jgi:hypothetical protein
MARETLTITVPCSMRRCELVGRKGRRPSSLNAEGAHATYPSSEQYDTRVWGMRTCSEQEDTMDYEIFVTPGRGDNSSLVASHGEAVISAPRSPGMGP